MSKCLVTKLSGVVNNKNLTPIGCIGFTAYPSNNTLKLECSGSNVEYFTANGEAVFTTNKSIYVSRIAANQVVYVKTDKPILIFISNKYELTKIDIYDSTEKSQIDIDFNDFLYCKKCINISLTFFPKLTGDLSSLSSLTNLQTLYLYNTSITGDLSSLSSLTNLQAMRLHNTSITGDLSSLSSLTNLQTLYLSNNSITGDFSLLSSLTNLQALYLYNTSITGDLSSLSSLTNLQTLYLYNTSITGDLSSLSSLIKLSSLKLGSNGTGYFKTLCDSLKTNGKTSGTLTFWAYNGKVKIDSQTECPNHDVIATFSEGSISYSGL